jgi:hypothetical protein
VPLRSDQALLRDALSVPSRLIIPQTPDRSRDGPLRLPEPGQKLNQYLAKSEHRIAVLAPHADLKKVPQ